jgi:pyruvate,orthophosphate dikinase
MTNIGLPVPPGFTITTEACQSYLHDGHEPDSLRAEVDKHLAKLEASMGRKLGDPADPLLVSVRSGAKFSMPGMMETVLNVGLTDESVAGLAHQAGGNDRFAWDSYRRLIQMFGKTVCNVPGEAFEHATMTRSTRRACATTRPDADDLKTLVKTYKQIPRVRPPRLPAGPGVSRWTWPRRPSSTRGTPIAPCHRR